MTTDRPDDRADEQIEAAAGVLSANWRNMHTNDALGYQRMLAHALSDAGLLVSPADQDEQFKLAALFAASSYEAELEHAEADRLRAQVAAVREIHLEHECTGYPDCMILFGGACAHDRHCNHCRRVWPCPTIRKLDTAGGGDDDQ